jgi:hypothetical protein
MLTYPEGLPLPLREGYGFQAVSPILRSKKMSGRSVQRRLYSSTPTEPSVSWLMSAAQAQLFMGWYEHVLLSGSQWFECPLRTPLGLELHRARFTDIYSGPDLVGVDHWRFTATLEMFKQPLIDKEWVTDAPEYILGSDIFDITMNRVWTQPRND